MIKGIHVEGEESHQSFLNYHNKLDTGTFL